MALSPLQIQATQTPGSANTSDAEAVDPKTADANSKFFNRAVPGQSLTAEPGQLPFERPAQFSDPDEALDFVLKNITNPNTERNLLRLLDAGVPVFAIVQPLLINGFAEGKWTMDVAMLIAQPLGAFVTALGFKAGINVQTDAPRDPKEGIVKTAAIRQTMEKAKAKATPLKLSTPKPANKTPSLLAPKTPVPKPLDIKSV